MSTKAKRTVTRTWVVGSVLMFGGGFAALLVSIATDLGVFLTHNLAVSVPVLILCLIVAGGVCVQIAAWIGAVINTDRPADNTWFNLLLWIGIMGIVTSPIVIGGLVWSALMLAYVISGPDGTAVQPPQQVEMTTPAEPPKTPVPAH